MNNKELLQSFEEVMVPNYSPLPMIPYKGEGSRIWDVEGNEYIDFSSGIAVTALGHNNPDLMRALRDQSEKFWHCSNFYTNSPAIELAKTLCHHTFAERVFFANSGAEANEAALKLARKYAALKHGENKSEIISFHNSFHGRTLFTLTAGGQPKYREGFFPLPAGFQYADYNDKSDIAQKISSNTCAVIMEPIIAEGGVIPAEREFVQEVARLCKEKEALLIFDEVQTGMGRSGYLYAYQDLGVEPDILTSAKALGCGFPIGAMLTTQEIAEVFTVGTHGSTFGGNPLATAVAKIALDKISDPRFLKNIRKKEELFLNGLRQINDKLEVFKEIRGKGLLIGCELKEEFAGKAAQFMNKGLQEGIMLLVAGPDVIRITPALNIPNEDIDEGMQRLEKTIAATLASLN